MLMEKILNQKQVGFTSYYDALGEIMNDLVTVYSTLFVSHHQSPPKSFK